MTQPPYTELSHPIRSVPKLSTEPATPASRPVITVDPRVRFGHPHIRGVATDVPVGMLVAGEAPDTVAEEFGLTYAELVLCCWHEAMYGVPHRRRAWKAWLNRHGSAFHHGDYARIPLPTEEDM